MFKELLPAKVKLVLVVVTPIRIVASQYSTLFLAKLFTIFFGACNICSASGSIPGQCSHHGQRGLGHWWKGEARGAQQVRRGDTGYDEDLETPCKFS